MIEACRPLVVDVAENAYSSAFRDHRFPPLTAEELEGLTISISILTPREPVPHSSEQDLLQKIRPGIDGVILQDGHYQGTFLPVMWEQLPDPVEFLTHLKIKAGMSPNYWSDDILVTRFTAEKIP